MSLKTFHIIFMTFATLFALGFGAWGVANYRATGDGAALLWGVLSLVGAVAAVAYGRWFLRKLRGVNYL